MKTCEDCGLDLPESKFNAESWSPGSCFRCRVSSIRLGFVGDRALFKGDTLVGGTIASDNRHQIEGARKNGLDPVPVDRGVSYGVSSNQINKLKSALS
jgi:hypothetical protein